jgi:hypothetical protein
MTFDSRHRHKTDKYRRDSTLLSASVTPALEWLKMCLPAHLSRSLRPRTWAKGRVLGSVKFTNELAMRIRDSLDTRMAE